MKSGTTYKCQTWNAAKAWISRKGFSNAVLEVQAIVNLTTPCPEIPLHGDLSLKHDGLGCLSDDPNFSLLVHDDPLSDALNINALSPSVLTFSGGSEAHVAMEVTKDRSGRSKREIKLRRFPTSHLPETQTDQRHNL